MQKAKATKRKKDKIKKNAISPAVDLTRIRKEDQAGTIKSLSNHAEGSDEREIPCKDIDESGHIVSEGNPDSSIVLSSLQPLQGTQEVNGENCDDNNDGSTDGVDIQDECPVEKTVDVVKKASDEGARVEVDTLDKGNEEANTDTPVTNAIDHKNPDSEVNSPSRLHRLTANFSPLKFMSLQKEGNMRKGIKSSKQSVLVRKGSVILPPLATTTSLETPAEEDKQEEDMDEVNHFHFVHSFIHLFIYLFIHSNMCVLFSRCVETQKRQWRQMNQKYCLVLSVPIKN